MKFGPVSPQAAVGAVLAHSLQGYSAINQRHYRLSKGKVLSEQNVQDLIDAGHSKIVVARLEAGDVEENDAATRLAMAIAPLAETLGLSVSKAGTGRVNFTALHPGVAVIDAAAIMAINAVDPMITIATVAQYHRVDTGTMVATIKIISYAVPERALRKAMEVASNALKIAGVQFLDGALIETQVSAMRPSLKGRNAMRGRLDRLGVALAPRIVVPHDEAAVAEQLSARSEGCIFILTASATSDVHDVGPQALIQAGGELLGFGMPVDPGNLLFFGKLNAKPVIGLPGCARSPALNGADWVLERMLCSIPTTQEDIAKMGVGGLLKEIPIRPQPRSIVES